METKPTEIGSSKMFGGYNKRYKHFSPTLGCSMTFHIYFPPSSSPSHKFPILYWLSGLTCTDENFIIKSGAQRAASAEGVALIAPDTSPSKWSKALSFYVIIYPCFLWQWHQIKHMSWAHVVGGLNVEGEADSWDFGVGAGFYLNATQQKWKNWRMYDYVVKELPKLLSENFPQLDTSKASISGHSMGGHGALTIYLKNLDKYKSASAFAPIANPINCLWGQKAFTNYLGNDKAAWEVKYHLSNKCPSFLPIFYYLGVENKSKKEGKKLQEYDATCLIKKFHNVSATILIDQGEDDKFLHDQLLAHKFEEACRSMNVPLLLRLQPGYDHSYFFISTFVDDHIRHHAQALKL
ncbi:hypothetical protein CXB51_002320 [Gossypium anomalum]|uniref:S-formylglutathione hydrolase n=1 Tax=Gossypium anomalum TaxID=47600 RepID=A0A8J6A2R1_9ROSI|nr:hypothetical protein CXB51_002320 [Gossypium anomalum]